MDFTFNDLLLALRDRGNGDPEDYVGYLMDRVYDERNIYPEWNSLAPEWVVDAAGEVF